jgi:uncharacterized protein YPO0396
LPGTSLAALLSLVLAIFGASWLNQRYIARLPEEFGKRIDARFDAIEKQFNARFDALLAEIRHIDQRIDSIERRLDQRIDSIEQRLERIERQLEAIFKPSPRA